MSERQRRYWLFKSDPDDFSWEDLLASKGKRTFWDGVRNYQARNLMRDEIEKGDGVLFYHSQLKPPSVVGIAEVAKGASPDPTQFEAGNSKRDPKSDPDDPTWFGVDLKARKSLVEPVGLPELKANPKLVEMLVTRRGQRLSVQPVTPLEWAEVLRMGGLKAEI